MSNEENKSKWVEFNLLNKNIYLAGFLPWQGMSMLLIIAVFLLIEIVIGAIIAMIMIYFGKKLKKENSKGTPNYLDSVNSYMAIKKRFTDEKGLLNYLERKK